MLKIVKVREYMTGDLICFSPETELAKAIETLVRQRISGGPVVNADKQLVGMLSESDCLKGILTGSYFEEASVRVGEVMSTVVDTIEADADIIKAAEQFVSRGIRRLPVLDGGRLVGQISRRDVLRAVNSFNLQGAPK